MRKNAVETRTAAPRVQPDGGGFAKNLRYLILENAVGYLAAPLLGLFAGFFLLFGGIFLAIAWTAGPQPLLDAQRYAPFTAHVEGRIVESWTALEFDPAHMPSGKLYWQPWSKISPCMIVEYAGDWGEPIQRGFCGNRFQFSDSFRLDDWQSLMPGVPFAFRRDANGFALPQMRLSKAALDWLAAHPPHSTFMFGKPPPTTALAALREYYDAPLDIALASWTQADARVPLAYDPQHPDAALPAKMVDDARGGFHWGGLIIALLTATLGLFVFRIGIALLFGQSGWLLWALTLAPLLALPWWSDTLPQLVRAANKDWADIAESMLDDINRATRFKASSPDAALLRQGERIVWSASEGEYRDSIGRLHFTRPDPPPASSDAALTALRAQTAAQVRRFDSAQQAALFQRLRAQHDAGHKGVQKLFTSAAEDTLRNAEVDAGAHRAAREFLIFAGEGNYYEDQLDKIEVAPRAAASSPE